ncbi:MAG: SDR family NAD(P)-dependent oxidoreductase [Leptospirales bacterium]|jgi:NAD(P)-dependent dehydrogenase (short-subunit alcohol dehydrogenase family)
MDLGLSGKTVLVTGAGAGIGRAIALAFAAEKSRVIGVDLRFDAADDRLCAALHRSVEMSVTDRDGMQALLAECTESFDGIDVLINNAGIAVHALAPAIKQDGIDLSLDVNLRAVFNWSCEFFRQNKKRGGAIVNIASVLGMVGAPLSTIYSATKGGVIAMTRSLSMEWAKYNFRVNAVCPGLIETAMSEKVRRNDTMREANIADIPMKRFGQPEEIARVCVFLASDAASFMTGQAVAVDGGFTAK